MHRHATLEYILDKLRYYDIFKNSSTPELVSMISQYCLERPPVQFFHSVEYKTIDTEITIESIDVSEQSHLCNEYCQTNKISSEQLGGFHRHYDNAEDCPVIAKVESKAKPKKQSFCAKNCGCCASCGGCGDKCIIF